MTFPHLLHRTSTEGRRGLLAGRSPKILPTIAIALTLTVIDARAASYNCGYAQCAIHGISKAECRKRGLPLALNWAKLPRLSQAVPGAVVVQRRAGRALGGSAGGHVAKILTVTGPCRATVIDNRGKPYSRDICSRLVAFVSPSRWSE